MAMRRIRPLVWPTRSRNQLLRALPGWWRVVRRRGLPALEIRWRVIDPAYAEDFARLAASTGDFAGLRMSADKQNHSRAILKDLDGGVWKTRIAEPQRKSSLAGNFGLFIVAVTASPT